MTRQAAPRPAARILEILIAFAVAAAGYVWLIGPIDLTLRLRPIHWDSPARPLRIAVGLLVLRLMLSWGAAAWARVGPPARATMARPYIWAPLALLAILIWPVVNHFDFRRAVRKADAARAEGRAQIAMATRPVLGGLEMLEGVEPPAGGAGRSVEISCGLPDESGRFFGGGKPPERVALRLGASAGGAGGDGGAILATCDLLPGQWRSVTVPLPESLGASDRLHLRFEGRRAARAARLAMVSRPRLTTMPDPAKPNLILISLDTLRADHLGAYGYKRPVSPHIDRIAGEGALFERAISQSPWTTPSHMSLFTSLFPTVHAVDSPTSISQRRLGADRRTLAETLGDAGYATGAFTGSGSISAVYGFWRGFDVYDETDKDDPARRGEDISGVFEKAARWMVDHRDGPFFLFFHSYEAHAPFVHETFLGEVPPDAGSEDPRRLIALYDGDILYADAFVGQLLALLDQLGLKEKTIVVLLSDHGEELEHPRYPGKRFGHGHTQYDDLLHVPLIVRAPGRVPPGLRVDTMVQVIDVMPSLLELLGLQAPQGMQGVSFARVFRGEPLSQRPALAEATNYGPERKALLDGRYKLIKVFPREDEPARGLPVQVPPEEFFDLALDPGERLSILDQGGARLDRLRKDLLSLVELNRSRRGAALQQEQDEETIRRLKSLGYLE